MNRSSCLVLAFAALVSGCRVDATGVDTRSYACTQDDQCLAGFVCQVGICQRPEETSAVEDGGTSPDAGNPASTRLGFVTPEQSVLAGQCSLAVTLEAQGPKGGSRPVDEPVTVTLEPQPASGTTFYSDAACTTALTSAVLAAGTSRVTFYFKATLAPSVSLGATAPRFPTVRQVQTVRPAAPTSAVFLTNPQTLSLNGCSARVDVELRDTYANPTPSTTQRSLTFTGSSSSLSVYSDAACTTAITDASFAATASRTSFYVKGRTLGEALLVATPSGLSAVRQSLNILLLVRGGSCQMPASDKSVVCRISPAQTDLSKTMLFHQARPLGTNPASDMVRCFLSSPEFVTCGRNASGSTVSITWKTVELASGLKVQHLLPECGTFATTLLAYAIDPVSPGNTFLLVGSENDRTALDDKDFFTAKLTSPTRMELQFSSACSAGWKGSVQVVQLDGAQVVRGSGALATGQSGGANVGLPSADLATTAVLFTYRLSNASTTPITCDRTLRGEVTSTSRVTFLRAEGTSNPACTAAAVEEISWERVNFGALARVQPLSVTLAAGASQTTATLSSAIDPARTVVFSSNQALNGQSGGESTFSGDDLLGETQVGMDFTSETQLGLSRDSARGTTKLNAFVVQFEP